MRLETQQRAQLGWTLRHPTVIASFVLLLCAIGVIAFEYIAYWRPQVMRYHAAMEREAVLRADVYRLRTTHGRMERYRHNREALDLLQARLANEASQAALISNLDELASHHDVRLLSESSREGKPDGNGLSPLIHTLEIEGSYHGVRQVIFGIARLPTLTLVRECRLSLEDQETGRILARLELVTYRHTDSGETS